MNSPVLATIPVIPDSAPFTPAQRAWLNGFFAGLLGGQAAGGQATGKGEALAPEPVPVVEDDEAMPWHDPALPMNERLQLADGKPKERLLMAAMAQLDCGACGYQCQTYAEAIARGEEKDLMRCAPGGKDTAKKLKELVAPSVAGKTVSPVESPKRPQTAAAGHDRNNPFPARLIANRLLNKPGSSKDTRLIAFDLKGSGLSYNVGDSLGVFPENCPESVNWLLDRLEASGAEQVQGLDGARTSLFEALLRQYQISDPSEPMVDLLAQYSAGPAHAEELRAMLANDGPGIPAGHHIIDLLTMYPTACPPIGDFVAALRPLQPRLYSIASSLKAHPDEVHLTVGVVRYVNSRQRQCKGVASTFLSDRLRPGQKARVFVQPSHGFRLPFDQKASVIMIGPGTGIAPFRAFLQERKTTNSPGKNWLFFGDQRSEFDYLYQDELETMHRNGVLTHLDTAFSRDQAEKVYVQNRLLQRSGEIWNWIERGAHLYVCGDARRMAVDVDNALRQIVATEGGMRDENAKAFLTNLTKTKRYQRDVY